MKNDSKKSGVKKKPLTSSAKPANNKKKKDAKKNMIKKASLLEKVLKKKPALTSTPDKKNKLVPKKNTKSSAKAAVKKAAPAKVSPSSKISKASKAGKKSPLPKNKNVAKATASSTNKKVKAKKVVKKLAPIKKEIVKTIKPKEKKKPVAETKSTVKEAKRPVKPVVVKKSALIIKKEKSSAKPGKSLKNESEPDIHEIESIDLNAILPVKEKPGRSKSRRKGNKTSEEAPTIIKRMPMQDLSAISYNLFKKTEKPEPAKIEAQPSVLVKTEIKKADPEKAEIKNKIFERCMFLQTNSVTIARKAMNDAQESANEEKGSMEEKFDSFRESMHITRDMYARQFQEGMNSLSMLKRINPNLEHNTVILGSVVYTDFQNYFISVSLGEILVKEDKFITISTSTPLFQALAGKVKGDKFKFRDKIYTILDVF